jgi:hypothetical protein
LIQGGITNLGGHSVTDVLTQAGLGAFLQGANETMMWIPRFVANARAAAGSLANAAAARAFNKTFFDELNAVEQAGYKTEVQQIKQQYKAQQDWNKDFASRMTEQDRATHKRMATDLLKRHEAQTATQGAAYERAVATHAGGTAGDLAEQWKTLVPAWQSIPSTPRGLVDMIVGSGQTKVSASFDAAMQAAKEAGKTVEIQIPRAAATALGITAPNDLSSIIGTLSPTVIASLQKAGRLPTQLTTVGVNAAEAIEKMTGQSALHRQAYRDVADALASSNLGTEAARAEYKSAQGLMRYVDKSKALVREGGQDVLDVEKLLAGRLSIPTIDILRKRGLGDALEGPLAATVTSPPQSPLAPPKPEIPPRPAQWRAPLTPPPALPAPPAGRIAPQVPEPEITSYKNPIAGHPWVSGLALQGAAHGLGLPSAANFLPFIAGATISNALPKELVTKAPIGDNLRKTFQFLPGLLSALEQGALRSYTAPPRTMEFDISAPAPTSPPPDAEPEK